MTLQEHIKKWDGKTIDTDGYYGGQCMDQMHQYLKDVYDIDYSVLAQPDAKSVYINFPNVPGAEYFKQIPNILEAIPKAGDVVFWGYNPSGHVAVYVEGDGHTFISFDQNYPVGSKCHLQDHTYKNVLGWLRPIKTPTGGTTESLEAQKIKELEAEKDKFEKLSIEQTKTIKIMENDAKGLEQKIVGLSNQIQSKNIAIDGLETQLEALQKERDVFHDLSERTSEEVKELKVSVGKAVKLASDWEVEVKEIKLLQKEKDKTQELKDKEQKTKDIKTKEEIDVLKGSYNTILKINQELGTLITVKKRFRYKFMGKNYSLVLIEDLEKKKETK